MKYRDTPIYERKTITRRGFLKGLGLGLGALAIPGALVLASSSPPVVEPEEVHVGYKYRGSQYADAGYFYCPYIPLMQYNEYGDSTPVMGSEMQFNTRYGKLTAPVAQR